MAEKSKINISSILKGVVFSYIVTFILVFILSIVYYFCDMSDKLMGIAVFAIGVLGVFLGAFLLSRTISDKGMLHGGILGVIYCVILLILSFFINMEFTMGKGMIINIFSYIGSGMLGGIIGINNKKRV